SVTDWTRRGEITAQNFGELFGEREVVFALDAAADGDDDISLAQIDGLFRFLERSLGCHSHIADFYWHRFQRSATSLRSLIAAKRTRLKCDEGWRLTIRDNIRVQLTEEDSTREGGLAAINVHANAIAN